MIMKKKKKLISSLYLLLTSDSNYPHPNTSFDEGENEGMEAHYKTFHLVFATTP